MYISLLDACRNDLFTSEDELARRYPADIVAGVLRVREMHQWLIANPSANDRAFVREVQLRHALSKTAAYRTLEVVKSILPSLAEASKAFHLWRMNEMLLFTFEKARLRGDTRTMERVASSYGRYNKCDKEEDVKITPDMVAVQPFTATDNPEVLGLRRIPNIRNRIKDLLAKYIQESPEIEDISFEEADASPDIPLLPDSL